MGAKFDILLADTPVFRVCRIEAGLLNAGPDLDADMTPTEMCIGTFVGIDAHGFIQRQVLERADRVDVAVVGSRNAKSGEVIGAFIRSAKTLDKSTLHAHCCANMSP